MRNPIIYKRVAEIICDFNFDISICDKINKFSPIDPHNLQIHTILNSWGQQLKDKYPKLKDKLLKSNQTKNMTILDSIISTFLFDG